jgi:hypothetical protein
MPFVVLVVLSVLGYVTMGVVLASVVAWVSNRYDKEHPMDMEDSRHLAFCSVFWPVTTVLFGMVGLGFGVCKLVMKSSGLVNGYVTYLNGLGKRDEIRS